MHSLNELRDWFMTGRGEDADETDILTTVTLTFSNGHSVQADLSLGWFDDEGGPANHIGMELWVASPDSGHDSGAGVDLSMETSWGYWTLEDIISVFNLDPDAPIWIKESEKEF